MGQLTWRITRLGCLELILRVSGCPNLEHWLMICWAVNNLTDKTTNFKTPGFYLEAVLCKRILTPFFFYDAPISTLVTPVHRITNTPPPQHGVQNVATTERRWCCSSLKEQPFWRGWKTWMWCCWPWQWEQQWDITLCGLCILMILGESVNQTVVLSITVMQSLDRVARENPPCHHCHWANMDAKIKCSSSCEVGGPTAASPHCRCSTVKLFSKSVRVLMIPRK